MSQVIDRSCYCRCAKEFEIKGSTKIKKKKKKEEAKNNNSADNKAFEGDDDESHQRIKNRFSLTPLLEDGELGSACETSTNATGAEIELLKKEKKRAICVTEARTNDTTGTKKYKIGNNTEQGNSQVAGSNEDRQRKLSRHSSLVTSMIYDLQREDTFIEQTVTSGSPSNAVSNSRVEVPQFKRQVTSTSVSVSVVTSKGIQKEKVSNGEDRVRRFGAKTMKRNCDDLLTGISSTENGIKKGKPKRKGPVTLNYYKDQNLCLSNDLKVDKCDVLENHDGGSDSTRHAKRSQAIDSESEKEKSCCFQWQPFFSNNKIKKASNIEEESEEIDIEKNENEVRNNEKNEKVSFLLRMKTRATRRKAMAAMCPCFTYLILDGETKENSPEKEKEQSDKNNHELR